MAQIEKECPERIKPLPSLTGDYLMLEALQDYAPNALIFNDSLVEP